MPTFSAADVCRVANHTADPFDDHSYYVVTMPYGPGYGRCWSVGEELGPDEVARRLARFAQRTSYEVACGRMLGPWGMRVHCS